MSDESQSEKSQLNMQSMLKNVREENLKVEICPEIDITELAETKYNDLKKQHDFISFEEAPKPKSILTGTYQTYSLPVYDFNQEMHRFNTYGYCANPDPTVAGFVFSPDQTDLKNKVELEGEAVNLNHPQFVDKIYAKTTKAAKKELTKKLKSLRDEKGKVLQYRGPWAGYGEDLSNGALTQEQQEMLATAEERKRIRLEEAAKAEEQFEPYSTFHLRERQDYKGQSFLQYPSGQEAGLQTCYIAKKESHVWVSSQKVGFQVAKFFPKYGHFLLVGNPQGKVHLYDAQGTKGCVQSYVGHTKAVRDVQFDHDGKHFLSSGFDGNVQYWDTQYGKVTRSFRLRGIIFNVRFHPTDDKVFFCGGNTRKIYQFNLQTASKTMEYNQHLGTINTITFIEENKFVSSSDDKKLFVWEYGIPVVTRHISEPQMHTITATAVHPGGQYYAGQSSDNQIVIYENKGGNFRRLRSKKFASHFCAGFACGIDFSNDGQFLISGDERGKIYFYDWKTSKNYRILQAHAGTCIGVDWHPTHPTRFASCGWEGSVKIWE